MAITASQLIAQARHAVGGALSGDIGGGLAIVNTAGRFMFSVHSWRNAERATTSLSFTASQSYIALPTNFGEIISLESAQGSLRPVEMTTLEGILMRRQWTTLGDFGSVYAAVSHTGTATPQLEIWPTPSASESNALTMWYRAKWVDITDDATLVPIEGFLEPLLVALVRAFARQYEMDDMGAVAAAVEGPEMYAAKRADGVRQRNMGPLQGGAAGPGGLVDYSDQSVVI